MNLLIFNETRARVPRRKLKRLFDTVSEEEGEPPQPGFIHLIFTSDHRIRALNRRYRSRDGVTDVLSFSLDEPISAEAVVGEIYVAVPTARRQARQCGVSVTTEILRLFAHGLLHLYGHRHEKEPEAARMRALEERYMTRAREG